MNTSSPQVANRPSAWLVIEASLVVNVASYFLAYVLRGRFTMPAEVMVWFGTTLPMVLGLKTLVLVLAFSKADVAAKYNFTANHIFFVSASLAAAGIFLLNLSVFPTHFYPIPRSVIAIDWALSLLFWNRLQSIGLRFAQRTAEGSTEGTMKRYHEEIPTISMGSGGPKVSC